MGLAGGVDVGLEDRIRIKSLVIGLCSLTGLIFIYCDCY